MRAIVFKDWGKKKFYNIDRIEYAVQLADGSIRVVYVNHECYIPAGEIANKFWKYFRASSLDLTGEPYEQA